MKFIPTLANTAKQAFVAQKQGQLSFVALSDNLSDNSSYKIHYFNVRTTSEMGLLGLAFHPKFGQVNKLFVNYNPESGDARTRIASFEVVKKGGKYALANETIIVEIAQPYNNHNGGQLAFGPDGYLYIGMGDGGKSGDPHGHGQNLSTLLGAILRIDIDNTTAQANYAIPQDNPFVKKTSSANSHNANSEQQVNAGARAEIWAYGVRNPWRFSFSPNGTLLVADVGQNKKEEVSVVARGDNLGWNIIEADTCFKPKEDCKKTNLVLPKISYTRDQGISITGGFVYTGDKIPALNNHYIYGDYILGNFWASQYPAFNTPVKIISDPSVKVVSFAQDFQGEIYATDLAKGSIYQLVP